MNKFIRKNRPGNDLALKKAMQARKEIQAQRDAINAKHLGQHPGKVAPESAIHDHVDGSQAAEAKQSIQSNGHLHLNPDHVLGEHDDCNIDLEIEGFDYAMSPRTQKEKLKQQEDAERKRIAGLQRRSEEHHKNYDRPEEKQSIQSTGHLHLNPDHLLGEHDDCKDIEIEGFDFNLSLRAILQREDEVEQKRIAGLQRRSVEHHKKHDKHKH